MKVSKLGLGCLSALLFLVSACAEPPTKEALDPDIQRVGLMAQNEAATASASIPICHVSKRLCPIKMVKGDRQKVGPTILLNGQAMEEDGLISLNEGPEVLDAIRALGDLAELKFSIATL